MFWMTVKSVREYHFSLGSDPLSTAWKFLPQFAFLTGAAKQPAAKDSLNFDCGKPGELLCERFIGV